MLERVWRKGNPLTLLVGMQTSTATMENIVEIYYLFFTLARASWKAMTCVSEMRKVCFWYSDGLESVFLDMNSMSLTLIWKAEHSHTSLRVSSQNPNNI